MLPPFFSGRYSSLVNIVAIYRKFDKPQALALGVSPGHQQQISAIWQPSTFLEIQMIIKMNE